MYFNYISMINHIIGFAFSRDIFRVIFFIYLIKPEENENTTKKKGWKIT